MRECRGWSSAPSDPASNQALLCNSLASQKHAQWRSQRPYDQQHGKRAVQEATATSQQQPEPAQDSPSCSTSLCCPSATVALAWQCNGRAAIFAVHTARKIAVHRGLQLDDLRSHEADRAGQVLTLWLWRSSFTVRLVVASKTKTPPTTRFAISIELRWESGRGRCFSFCWRQRVRKEV